MSASTLFNDSTVVLGIETSCDETAAAVVMGGNDVLSSVVATQIDLHARMAAWCQKSRVVRMLKQ